MRDEAELQWYLTIGTSFFERSTFGAVLDAGVLYAFGTSPCPVCHGAGIVDRRWYGRDASGNKVLFPTGKSCSKCDGRGALVGRLVQSDEPITARPTCHRDFGARQPPPDQVLVRYARVSRRLGKMPLGLRTAICAAYGDVGEAQLGSGLRGRSWALAPLTKPGKELLAMARRARDVARSMTHNEEPVALLTALAQIDAVKPNKIRRALLQQAAAEARELLLLAELSWETSTRRKHAA